MLNPDVKLIEIDWPDFGPDPTPPTPTSADVFAERLAAARVLMERGGYTHLAVYGDREYFANMAYLTGFDPRFEEALLILSADPKPLLIVGNECLGYLPISALYRAGGLRIERYPTFSLLGQPRSGSRQLRAILADEKIATTARVGCVGWKYQSAAEHPDAAHACDLPSYIVDALRSLAGYDQVLNATDLLMHPAYGMRATCTAEEIAYFEYTGILASEGVKRMLLGLKPGMLDYEVAQLAQLNGMPLGCHMTLVTGDTRDYGMNSPIGSPVRRGEPFATNVCYWGSNVCRAGWAAESASDLPLSARDYVPAFAVPYFSTVGAWFEALRLGTPGDTLQQIISDRLPFEQFGITLNPGHLIHLDEWLSSPIYPGSDIPLSSGMAIQVDIIPSSPTYFSSRMEDGMVLADATLQHELSTHYSDCYQRCLARRTWMRDVLGMPVSDDVLPLSNIPAIVPPFFLSPHSVLALTH
ncbi:MAG: aminopeptidase P family N-terminal domain-containing protein [Anaerolineae bacterium]